MNTINSWDVQPKYEVWYRFIHEMQSDGTIRDVYGLAGGNTTDVKVVTYGISHED